MWLWLHKELKGYGNKHRKFQSFTSKAQLYIYIYVYIDEAQARSTSGGLSYNRYLDRRQHTTIYRVSFCSYNNNQIVTTFRLLFNLLC